jgi:hypothetical protein
MAGGHLKIRSLSSEDVFQQHLCVPQVIFGPFVAFRRHDTAVLCKNKGYEIRHSDPGEGSILFEM